MVHISEQLQNVDEKLAKADSKLFKRLYNIEEIIYFLIRCTIPSENKIS